MKAPAILNAGDDIRAHLDEHVVLVCQSGQRAAQAEDAQLVQSQQAGRN